LRAGFYHRLRRHPRWAIGIATGVSVCLLVLTKLAIDWPVFPAKVPQEVQQAAQGKPDLVGSAYVYDFWGNFIDSEHLWRVKVNAEIVTAVAKECSARELASADEVPGAFWHQSPYWWQPSRNRPGRYFMSAKFEADGRGQDGPHYLLVYDELDSVLYVWFKNNF